MSSDDKQYVGTLECVTCKETKSVNQFATPDECETCFQKQLDWEAEPDWDNVLWRGLLKGEVVRPGDWIDSAPNGMKDDPIWVPCRTSVGKYVPDPLYPAHRRFRRVIDPQNPEWLVHVKGAQGEYSWEISVVREDNQHGLASFGGFGEEKLLISHNGGHCRWPVTEFVWDKQIELAEELAAKLNSGQIQPPEKI